MRCLVFVLLFIVSQVNAQSEIKKIKSFTIESSSGFDSTIIISDDRSIIRQRGDLVKNLNESDKLTLEKFITDLFVIKKCSIVKKIERIDGYTYSSNDLMSIYVKYNEIESEEYKLNLSVSNYKIEYSEEFKEFLRFYFRL